MIKWLMNLIGFGASKELDPVKSNPVWPFPTSVKPAELTKPAPKSRPRKQTKKTAPVAVPVPEVKAPTSVGRKRKAKK
jgi:hypothetical protein